MRIFSVTALLETHEEVGIHPDKMEIIKFLHLPISLQVTLWFIFFWNLKEVCFVPDPTEVSGIIELPLSVF
jgi:8-oxo-dGTP pyrophosphatase MutT (NUDIX family)